MDPITISLLSYSLISTGFCIWFGIENSTLREKIEKIEQMIVVLNKRLESTQRELEALKKWHFIKISKLKNEIEILQMDIFNMRRAKYLDEQNIDAFINRFNNQYDA